MTKVLTQKTFRTTAPNFLVFFMSVIPFSFLPFSSPFISSPGLGALYFWGIYGPEKISLWVIFSAGFLQDGLFDTPLGLFGTLNLLFWLLTLMHRKYLFKRTFLAGWIGFFILCSVMLILKEGTLLALKRPFYFESMVFETIIMLLTYPFVALACFYVYKKSL